METCKRTFLSCNSNIYFIRNTYVSFATTSGTPVQPNATKEWAELRGSKSYQNIDSVTNDLKIKLLLSDDCTYLASGDPGCGENVTISNTFHPS